MKNNQTQNTELIELKQTKKGIESRIRQLDKGLSIGENKGLGNDRIFVSIGTRMILDTGKLKDELHKLGLSLEDFKKDCLPRIVKIETNKMPLQLSDLKLQIQDLLRSNKAMQKILDTVNK